MFIGILILILFTNYVIVCSMPVESKMSYFAVLAVIAALVFIFKMLLGG